MEWVIVGVVAVLVVTVSVVLWASYHGLAKAQAHADQAWSDIVAQLARGTEPIAALVSAVSAVAPHESPALDAVSRARDAVRRAEGPADAAAAEESLQAALADVFRVADGYPQLQRSADYLDAHSALVRAQDALQSARRRYNGDVRELNAKASAFPGRLFAGVLKVSERSFFEVSSVTAISEPPRVQF